MKRFFILISFLIAFAACKEVFVAPPKALLQASLLNTSTKIAMSSTVSAWGIGRDIPLVADSTLEKILFPLSTGDTTYFVITFDSVVDTLTFFHETTQEYDSMESGFYYDFKLDSIAFTHNRIDSIAISDILVTTKWHENIKLYIRPLPALGN
jgi:hypothetical protein